MAKMKVSAKLIKQLGVSAYTISQAICEIIANSIDAEAKEIIIDINKDNNILKIIDNGNGMTREIIEKHFLTLASSKKEGQLGSKGIGKIALFAIGNNIKIETKSKKEKGKTFELDYKEMLKDELLDNHEIKIEDNNFKEKGTIITIHDFSKKSWSLYKNHAKGIFDNFSSILSRGDISIKIKYKNDDDEWEKKIEIANQLTDIDVFYSLDEESDLLMEEVKQKGLSWKKDELELSDDIKKTLSEYIPSKSMKSNYTWISNGTSSARLFNSNDTTEIETNISGYIALSKSSRKRKNNVIENEDKFIASNTTNAITLSVNGRVIINNLITYLKNSDLISDRFWDSYLIGNINADFLSEKYKGKHLEDIITNNRQSIIDDSPRFEYLLNNIALLVKKGYESKDRFAKIKKEEENKSNKKESQKFRDLLVKNKIISQANLKDYEKLTKEAKYKPIIKDRYVMISHKEHDKENASLINKIIKKIDVDNQIKILQTSSDDPADTLSSNSNLYKEIKSNFKNYRYTRTAFIAIFYQNSNLHIEYEYEFDGSEKKKIFKPEDYINNWYTDIEYGMAYQLLDTESIFNFFSGDDGMLKEKPDPLVYPITYIDKSILAEDRVSLYRDFNSLINEVLKLSISEDLIRSAINQVFDEINKLQKD